MFLEHVQIAVQDMVCVQWEMYAIVSMDGQEEQQIVQEVIFLYL
jgi:hypothetical protein